MNKPRYIDGETMAADITGDWIDIDDIPNIGFQAVWDTAAARTPVVTNTDAVVSGTKTWTFANAAFTAADVGGTFTITGTDLGNDGTYTIASRTNATTVVSVEAPTADETFDGTEALTIESAGPTGDIIVEISNDGPVGDGDGKKVFSGNLGPTELTLTTDQIAGFPAGTASDFYFEFVGIAARWIRFSYDATSGAGTLKVGANAKVHY
jgi:hypothetical protein